MKPCGPPTGPVSLRMLDREPRVSILVPSFNQGKFIRATIDSILQQDYRLLHIYVVDGGSTDKTLDVLSSFGDIPQLSWISEHDNGVVDAVNKGFERLDGDILGIQSSDDVYLPGAISRVVREFQEHADVGLLYGDTIKVDTEGRELLKYRIGPWSLRNLLLLKTWIPQPSAFFRREMLDTCGGWDESIPYSPDTDLWIRMAFRTQVKKIDEYLSQRRMHDAQRDTNGAKIIDSYCRMIDQSPDIAASSPELQRAAQAGKYLMKIRYNPSGSDWANAWNRFRAGQVDSELRNHAGVFRDLLLPVRRVLSRVKRSSTGQSSGGTN